MSRRRKSSFSINNKDDSFQLRGSLKSSSGAGFEAIENTSKTKNPKHILTYTHLFVALVLCVVPWIPSLLLEKEIDTVRKEAERYQAESDDLLLELNAAIENRRQLKAHVDKLTKENTDLLKILKLHGDMVDPENNLYRKAEEEEEIHMNRIKDIETAIQTLSRNQLKEKFGQRQRELKYKILWVNPSNRQSETIVIQTLPIDFVPHSIAVFDHLLKNSLDGFEGSTMTKNAGDCLHVKSSIDAGPSTSLSFVEQTMADSMVGFHVLIGKRGSKLALLFCSEKSDRSGHELDTESVFASVVEGSTFLEKLSSTGAKSSDQNWNVHFIQVITED